MKKSIASILILVLVASSIIMIQNASAQSIPKPSVPEFSVTIADHSYNIPEKTDSYTNPYTNKTSITTTPGHRVTNKSIEVSIKNQAFTPFTDENGNTIRLF